MQYTQLLLTYSQPEVSEILIALLTEAGYEGFFEEENQLTAYIPEADFSLEVVDETLLPLQENFTINYTYQKIENQNWNALWESNFEPVYVRDKIYVRALFHEAKPEYPIELLIQPKMSFGTGHHATTAQVMAHMLDLDFTNKAILDFGCGTGILAILAKHLGAAQTIAIDNDTQCIENTIENCTLNNAEVEIALGDINLLHQSFDVILANITRNTILAFLPAIKEKLNPNGIIICSGFYEENLPAITEAAKAQGLHLEKHSVEDKWCAAVFS
ncbi:MAG: 50S ribosomal protein L11 methyltransferase [Bacteroidetes bacterium]|nr:50S ribosomal protein L11 methyltransferase [Bacteroidota bacterium]